MKCILTDIRRALTRRWFPIAIFAALAAMLISSGIEADYLITALANGDTPDWGGFIYAALTGQLGLLVLPALCALPFSKEPLEALLCGALRSAIFRTGRRAYIMGQVAACAVSGMLVQGAAFVLLCALLEGIARLHGYGGIGYAAITPVFPFVLSRMLAGGLWACIGGGIALITATLSAAYIAPLCLCYALTMVGTRFFAKTIWLNPMNWITAPGMALPILSGAAVGLMGLVLRKKVEKYV
jgi:hypothetical protein